MNGSNHVSQDDLALNSLQALTPEESAAVREHLLTCEPCRAELAVLQADVALIGLSVDRHPVPAGARDRFLSRIAATESVATNATATESVVNKKPESVAIKKPSEKVVVIRRTAWLAWSAAAVLAFATVLLGLRVGELNTQLQTESAQNAAQLERLSGATAKARQVLDVLTSHNAQHVLLTASKTPAMPSGRAVYLANAGSLVFQASNLKQISTDKTYELWVIPATGKPIPAGLFRPDANGSASVVLPALPANTPAKAFGVTIENASGSDIPTAPLVMAGAPATGE